MHSSGRILNISYEKCIRYTLKYAAIADLRAFRRPERF